eukprot:TRINITY_DN6658_c0_g1_i4.p1 TRINITY_DN6658_c0_g1~~TRINITY_DN6658_c0_g1_i4.p1  ORF type:complete len:178 (+),score=56.02 TRINITY_DN6658_c0_g1_i4:236-769(+)
MKEETDEIHTRLAIVKVEEQEQLRLAAAQENEPQNLEAAAEVAREEAQLEELKEKHAQTMQEVIDAENELAALTVDTESKREQILVLEDEIGKTSKEEGNLKGWNQKVRDDLRILEDSMRAWESTPAYEAPKEVGWSKKEALREQLMMVNQDLAKMESEEKAELDRKERESWYMLPR